MRLVPIFIAETCSLTNNKRSLKIVQADNRELKHNDALESRKETGSGYFACQDTSLSKIFELIVQTSEKILNNINVVM